MEPAPKAASRFDCKSKRQLTAEETVAQACGSKAITTMSLVSYFYLALGTIEPAG